MSSTTMHQHAANTAPTRSEVVRYSLIFAVLLAALLTVFLIRAVNGSSPPSEVPTQRSTNSTSGDATRNTGAPTHETNTPADRTVPGTSGGNANTILSPQSQ